VSRDGDGRLRVTVRRRRPRPGGPTVFGRTYGPRSLPAAEPGDAGM